MSFTQSHQIKAKYSQQNQSNQNIQVLNQYKRRLLVEFIALFIICLLFLLQRIFYQIIIHAQSQNLNFFQTNNGLIIQKNDSFIPKNIQEQFYIIWSYFSQFRFQFLIYTHIFISLYVVFNSRFTVKIMLVSFTIIQIVTYLQLIYKGARPYWTSTQILSSRCIPNYNHPNIEIILLLMIPGYFSYCWIKKFENTLSRNRCNIFGILTIISLAILVVFINYVTGTIFIINVCLSVLLIIIFFVVLDFLNDRIDYSLQYLFNSKYSKSSQVKWIFMVIISLMVGLMIYAGSNTFQRMNWIENELSCQARFGQDGKNLKYNRIVGSWFNFQQTAVCFSFIAIILGATYCNFSMKSVQWFQGNKKQKLINFIIGNIFIIPSWIIQILIKKQSIDEIGINSYVFNAIHYFLLYLWLFGYMPLIIFEKLMKTTQQLSYNQPSIKQNNV